VSMIYFLCTRDLSGFNTSISTRSENIYDTSLARPGRKQATATKLGIYSTYSP